MVCNPKTAKKCSFGWGGVDRVKLRGTRAESMTRDRLSLSDLSIWRKNSYAIFRVGGGEM